MATQMFIGGTWTDGMAKQTQRVTSPATGKPLGEVPISTAADVDAAVKAARKAQRELEAMTVFERSALCHRVAELLESRVDELARELALEQGKPFATEAREEIHHSAGNFRLHAEEGIRLDTQVMPSETRGKLLFTLRKPIGIYALITPWNFPLLIPAELAAPALVTGNAVILKPSEFTPLIAARLVEICEQAGFPPGSVNLVYGARETGEALVTHPGVTGIAFVGSAATGEAIVRAAGMKRTMIEASGNGPQIVLEDADLDAAAAAAVRGAAFTAGQVCVATERVLVQRKVHDEFVDRLLEDARKVVLGDPMDPKTTMGPLNNEPTAAKMDRHLSDALKKGGKLLLGGERASGFPTQLYYPMTVVDSVGTDQLLFREESFGPVLPITTFASDDEAIALANDSDLGLQAAVFTSSLKRAFRYVHEIRAGNLQINESTCYFEGRPPFGGAAGTKSGWGRIQIQDFTDLRTISIDYEHARD
ncbi:MAG TPA: aldehyde dehydrogenase family protein [Myxococcota bacterium]|nr:aldehyde dehydrogenase family protein [Myxococcota bacterium]